MPHTNRFHRFVLFVSALALLALAPCASAQSAATQPAAARRGAPPPLPAVAAVPAAPADDFDAERVREQFYEVLQKYPPALGRVLKLDPSLMANEAYLAPYPGVALYLARHPEIGRNPSYFLERISTPGFGTVMDPGAQKRREIQEMLAAFAAFLVFLVVTGVVVWIIRTIIDSRRWNRVSKTQAEVHTKLLERFSSNEDLLAYIQTPVGRRFLESGPTPLPEDARPIGAPFSRILLSVQAGIVLAVAAVGMLVLSRRLDEEVSAFFLVTGVLSLAIGVGFLVSSAVAYGISSRLGLVNRADSEHA
jgi:hypothetical protein